MIVKHIGKIIFVILSFVIILIVINSKTFEKRDAALVEPKKLEAGS